MSDEKRTQPRKAYAPDGQKSQKMMAFRVDNDLLDWLNSQPNKGRYINELIRTDKKRQQSVSGATAHAKHLNRSEAFRPLGGFAFARWGEL